jgi:predicted RNase H-like HicB family nuclease
MKLTLLITQGTDFLIGSVKEIPAVLTQGKSISEVKENILDALELYLEDMREEQNGQNVIYQEELMFA